MLVTLLVKFRNKDCKTTELGLLLQVLPVRIVTFVETLGSHLNNLRSCNFQVRGVGRGLICCALQQKTPLLSCLWPLYQR